MAGNLEGNTEDTDAHDDRGRCEHRHRWNVEADEHYYDADDECREDKLLGRAPIPTTPIVTFDRSDQGEIGGSCFCFHSFVGLVSTLRISGFS